jgi:hypothetical protein
MTIRRLAPLGAVVAALAPAEGQPALLPCSTATERRVGTPAAVPAFLGAIGAPAGGLVAWTDRGGPFARPAAS